MNEKDRSQFCVLQGHHKCIYIVCLYPDPLSPSPSASSVMKTPINTEDDPEPEYAVDLQMGYYSVYLYNSNIGGVMKMYL
jgi:hypothetical protein